MDVDLSDTNNRVVEEGEAGIDFESSEIGVSLPSAEDIKTTIGATHRRNKLAGELMSSVKSKGGELMSSAKSRGGELMSSAKSRGGELMSSAKGRGGELMSSAKGRGGELMSSVKSKVVAPTQSRLLAMKKWQLYSLIGGIFLIVIIGISAGVAGRDEAIDARSASTGALGGMDFTDAKYLGWAGNGDKDRYAQTVEFCTDFFGYGKEETNKIYEFGSPQNLAANWLSTMDKDKFAIPYTTESEENYYFIQRYALVVFHYAMGGLNWTYKSRFLTSHLTCEWNRGFNLDSEENFLFGVQCADKEQVSYIFMPGNGLRGTIPMELGYLTKLTHISLFGNEIKGTIPETFSKLTSLNFLAMESNMISGSIPAWFGSSFSRLKYLALGDNYLTGSLPDSLNRLTRLEEVALDGNDLTGSVTVFEEMDKLRRLFLGENNFEGTLDNEFFGQSKIKELDIASNNFEGRIPNHFFNGGQLQLLDVHNNKLQGPAVPPLESVNVRMEFYSAYENSLDSMQGIGDLLSLTHLDLSANAIEEVMPGAGLAKLLNLNYLFLANNPFLEGTIPSEFVKLTQLEELSLQHTHRTGTLPEFIPLNLTDLVLLDLGKNNLEGNLPNHMDKMKSLEFLLLNQNQFTGTIKKKFKGLQSLQMMLLDQNDITGGANHVCGLENLKAFSADCPGELDCDCCQSYCCGDSFTGDKRETTCYDNTELVANFDLDWVMSMSGDAGYERNDYVFSENLIFRPASSDKDV